MARSLTLMAHCAPLAAGAAVLLSGAPSQAHDIWLTARPASGGLVAEVDFGDLAARELADPKRIVALELVSSGGRSDLRHPLTAGTANGHPAWISAPFEAPRSGVLAVAYDNGFWLQLPGDKGETNASKLMAPNGTAAHMTVKYGKMLLGPGAYSTVLGERLELVALQDPYALPPGATLRVRLVLAGKPIPNTEIAYTDGLAPIPDAKQPTVKTGADGVAEIPLRRKGPHLLATDIEVAPLHPGLADRDHIYASLAFDTSR
jgi:uncharacterized GH25 family protein